MKYAPVAMLAPLWLFWNVRLVMNKPPQDCRWNSGDGLLRDVPLQSTTLVRNAPGLETVAPSFMKMSHPTTRMLVNQVSEVLSSWNKQQLAPAAVQLNVSPSTMSRRVAFADG